MTTKAPPAPWYTSRTVWVGVGVVLSNALALLGASGMVHLPAELTAAVLALWNSLLGVLAVVFRWNASGPLTSSPTTKGGSAVGLLLAACISLPLLGGCTSFRPAANLTPEQKVFEQYGKPLSVAAGVYEDTLRTAGRLHHDGTLSDEQLEQVRKAGQTARAALVVAQSALQTYLAHQAAVGGGSPPLSELYNAQAQLAKLLEIARGLGVIR